MAKLTWDETGKRIYETGVDHGVLYTKNSSGEYKPGVAWNGLTTVTESPSGAEETKLYADNIKYLSLLSAEDFGFTVECYTYPDEWEACDGSYEAAEGVVIGQQPRATFGMCYRTVVGNDEEGELYGYKLHLIYGAKAKPSDRAYSTINDSPDAITFSYECTTTPVNIDNDHKPSARVLIDSTKADETQLAALEAILYGTESTDPRLPLPAEVVRIMTGASGETGATGATGSTTAPSSES